MSIITKHISIITFLRPGLVKVVKNDNNFEEFFVQDGIVEFFNDTLVLLSASAINVKNLSKEFLDKLMSEIESKLAKDNITDQDQYILNHKKDTIKDIRI